MLPITEAAAEEAEVEAEAAAKAATAAAAARLLCQICVHGVNLVPQQLQQESAAVAGSDCIMGVQAMPRSYSGCSCLSETMHAPAPDEPC